MSAFWNTRDQNARVRKRFNPCFVSVIASRARDFARVRHLNALLPCTRFLTTRGGCTYSSDSGDCVHALPILRASLHRCVIDESTSKRRVGLCRLVGRHNQPVGKASKARLSDGRQRPPVARRDRRDKVEMILWRWFRSGPVIILVEVKRELGSMFFTLYRIVARRAFDRKTMSKEYVYTNSRQMYVHIPWVPAIVYMPFGSSLCLRSDAHNRCKKPTVSSPEPHIDWQHVALTINASKARLPDGRRRPPMHSGCDPVSAVPIRARSLSSS